MWSSLVLCLSAAREYYNLVNKRTNNTQTNKTVDPYDDVDEAVVLDEALYIENLLPERIRI